MAFPSLFLKARAFFFLITAVAVSAPATAGVEIGSLRNGVTYYIQPNQSPKDTAVFMLVIKTGFLAEQDEETGTAHFLEHMAFRGTKSFPRNTLIRFLENQGMAFGADLSAYTGHHDIQFVLNLPTANRATLTKGIQILSEWSANMTLEPLLIELERDVIRNEYALRSNYERREQEIEALFGAPYQPYFEKARANLNHITPEMLRGFYRKWFTPDRIGVIAVGDFDARRIRTAIKKHFSKLKPTAKATNWRPPKIQQHDDTRYFIGPRKKLTDFNIALAYKKWAPVKRGDAAAQQVLRERLFAQILTQRLKIGAKNSRDAVQKTTLSYSKIAPGVNTLYLSAMLQGTRFSEGLKMLLSEAEALAIRPISTQEFEAGKQALQRELKKDTAKPQASQGLAKTYRHHFVRQESFADAASQLAWFQKHGKQLTVDLVQTLAQEWVHGIGRVIIAAGPENRTSELPKTADLANWAVAGDSAGYENETSKSVQLMTDKPRPGKIINRSQSTMEGVTEWTLSNGIRVILYPFEQDDNFRFHGFSAGGLSTAGEQGLISAKMALDLVRGSPTGGIESDLIEEEIQRRHLRVRRYMGDLREGITGYGSREDSEFIFQLVHLYFTKPQINEKWFRNTLLRRKAVLKTQAKDEELALKTAVDTVLYENHYFHLPITPASLADTDRQTALQFINGRFGNAADFTFVFVGNIDESWLQPIVETYLASLPAKPKKTGMADLSIPRKRGYHKVRVEMGSNQLGLVKLLFTGTTKFSLQDRLAIRWTANLVRLRLRELLREELGESYVLNVTGTINPYPSPHFQTAIEFSCDFEKADMLAQKVFEELEKMRGGNISPDLINRVRSLDTRVFHRSLNDARFWLQNLVAAYWYGSSPENIYQFKDRLKEMTTAKYQGRLNDFFNRENCIHGTLVPQTKTKP